jgi:DNA-binding NarL/FixJ family response regulator
VTPIRVMLADDHALVRAGIRALLQNVKGIEVIAEAGDGREVLDSIEQYRPDVILMDLTMPGMNGLDAAGRVTKEWSDVRVIILSMHTNEEYVLQALRTGAAGYLLKDAGTAELELAITAVAHGETYLSPPVSKHVISDYVRRVGGESPAPASLTPRQHEILKLIAEGHALKEIAQMLSISVKTVETHRSQLMERLDIHDTAGLVRHAIRIGLVSTDS